MEYEDETMEHTSNPTFSLYIYPTVGQSELHFLSVLCFAQAGFTFKHAFI